MSLRLRGLAKSTLPAAVTSGAPVEAYFDQNGRLVVVLGSLIAGEDQVNDVLKTSSGGNVASGTADTGNPIKVGGVALAHGTNPTAVAANARTNWYFNRAGVPFMIGGHPNVQTIAQNYTSAQTDAALITVSAGTKIVVTGFLVACHNTNTVNVSARLGFGTANTPAYGAAQLFGTHPGIAAGSGFGRGGGGGILGIGADNEDVRVTLSVPTGGSVDVTMTYYTIES